MSERIWLSTPTMHGEEQMFVKEAFDTNWVAPLGKNVTEFENEIARYVGCKAAAAMTAGTHALHMAVKLAGINTGDVVLCSDMTFAASVNPVIYEGGTPVFVDSEYATWNMDPVALEKAFEKYPQARVVVLVHLYGTPADMDAILNVCEKHQAVLIEDAAEALGLSYKDKLCGTFGRYNVLSFNGNKIITTSGGGMLVTKEQQAREKAFFWATQARENAYWYQHEEIGYNYRMSNVCAGIGRGQLLYLQEHCERKKSIYERYCEGFKALPLRMNPYLEESHPNHWLSCVLFDKEAPTDPITVLERLKEKGIESRPVWKPMHMQPVFRDYDFITVSDTTVDKDIFERGLCLPSDIKMTPEDQQYVIDVFAGCF